MRKLTKLKIITAIVFLSLFFLTLFRSYTTGIIERADLFILENKRSKIVEQVKNGELKPNVNHNGWVCELPFEFPVVSNGGNDIGIYQNKDSSTITVQFWIFRNFFESPSTYLIYTDNPKEIERIENKIKTHPDTNRKIKNNWYRTYGY